jgi:putative flippase GtrA
VGGTAFVVDVGLFNLLLDLGVGPLTSKTGAVLAATTWSYGASRCWAYRDHGAARERMGTHGEYALFIAINAVGLGIGLACLGLTYYVFGLHSVLAQNISTNGVGLALGMAFRFWAYRTLVFPPPPQPQDGTGASHSTSPDRTSMTPTESSGTGVQPSGSMPLEITCVPSDVRRKSIAK